MNPSVAVVILNWNGRKLLEQFLPSVLATTYSNHTVWVADNHSDDDSVAWLQANYPGVHIIQNPDNGGYARGYNLALAHIQADYFVLLNSDVEVTPGWIEPVIALLEQDEKRAACQPKILDFNRRTHFEYAGAVGGFMDAYGYPFCRGRIFDYCEEDLGQYDTNIEVFWATGACLFIKRKAWEKAGGLYEPLFAHMEEIDLCWRLKNLGYSIWCCPQSVVYHVGGGTLSKQNSKKTFLNFRNSLIVILRNTKGFLLWRTLMFRFCFDLLSILFFLTKGRISDSASVVNAQWKFITHFFIYQKAASYIVKSDKILSTQKKKSIVIEHFIFKKNIFAQLQESENKF